VALSSRPGARIPGAKGDVMATLPAHPNLDRLRQQAKDLLRAAQAGDADAIDRIRRVSDRLTLATAQLTLAREYGFSSRARLKEEAEARTSSSAREPSRSARRASTAIPAPRSQRSSAPTPTSSRARAPASEIAGRGRPAPGLRER
jgi:hypothetical protein